MMFVKPAKDGAVVRFPPPSRRTLAAEGEIVPDLERWWLRRLAHGDVVIAQPPKVAPQPSPPSPPAAPSAPGAPA